MPVAEQPGASSFRMECHAVASGNGSDPSHVRDVCQRPARLPSAGRYPAKRFWPTAPLWGGVRQRRGPSLHGAGMRSAYCVMRTAYCVPACERYVMCAAHINRLYQIQLYRLPVCRVGAWSGCKADAVMNTLSGMPLDPFDTATASAFQHFQHVDRPVDGLAVSASSVYRCSLCNHLRV